MKVNKMAGIIITFVLILSFVLILGATISHYWVYTPKFTDSNKRTIPGSIAEFTRIELGGHSHGILIRGKNQNNSIILFLHAGPGLSETGMMRNLNPELEDFYTMVYLDHRGACKSFSPFMDYTSVNTSQLVEDIHELTLYLKKRFKKDRIIIMGHSFGAGFAAYAAAWYPEDYSAIIGIGMPVCVREADRLSYDWGVEQAQKEDNKRALKELIDIKGYWEKTDQKEYFDGMMVNKKWIGYYGGQIYGKKGFVGYVLEHTLSKEVNIFDYIPYMLGMMKCGPASWEIFVTNDLRVQAPEFKCPLILITGRNDYNAYPNLVNDYFNEVKAPVKQHYWMKNSAHMPHFEENETFRQIMIKEIPFLINQSR